MRLKKFMDYKTGSYKIKARKLHKCEDCEIGIIPGSTYFARIKVISEKKKNYNRFHFNCARNINNLNEYERQLLYIDTKTQESIAKVKKMITEENKEALNHLISVVEQKTKEKI